MAEQVYAEDLKSSSARADCGFESHPEHERSEGEGVTQLLVSRVGFEDRSDMQSADCVVRGGLRACRSDGEARLVGDPHPGHYCAEAL